MSFIEHVNYCVATGTVWTSRVPSSESSDPPNWNLCGPIAEIKCPRMFDVLLFALFQLYVVLFHKQTTYKTYIIKIIQKATYPHSQTTDSVNGSYRKYFHIGELFCRSNCSSPNSVIPCCCTCLSSCLTCCVPPSWQNPSFL